MGSEAGDNGRTNPPDTAGANPDSSKKLKKPSKTVTNFFTPLSQRTRLAAEVVQSKTVELPQEPKDEDFQEANVSAVLAAIFDKKPGKKKAKKGKGEKVVESSSPQPVKEPSGSQPACPIEQKQEMGSPAPEKKQARASPAKKKLRKQQSSTETKPMVGVHGSDLRMQARLAAEENARLSAGKVPHPFFARPKAGGAKALVVEETAHVSEGQSLPHAQHSAEESVRMSPAKPPHPFFARQKMGGAKTMAVDETSHNFESGSLAPCPPLHVTQNVSVEEAELAWDPRWTWRNVAERTDQGGEVKVEWLSSRCRPLFTWSWPSWSGGNRWRQSISQDIALQQLVAYLVQGGKFRTQYVLGEEVQSEAGYIEKLAERLSTYYYSHAKGAHLEPNPTLRTSIESQEKDVNSTQNLLWTDRYQPQTSQEVCGNRESVKSLSTWLQTWREKILSQKGAVKKLQEAEDGEDDNDSDFEDSPSDIDDDSEDLHNCLLVTGPVGCGKSAAIYACAKEQGFTVIEVNASECRNGALIKHKFKEAMESHGLSNRSSTTPVDASDGQEDTEQVLKRGEVCRRSIFQDEDSQSQFSLSQGGSRSNPPPPSLRRLRVILFEDVDTVFEEDSGFMGALALLARTSKCPIIFSSNSREPVLPQIRRLQSLEFQQLPTVELVVHAFMVCMAEGVACSPGIVERIVRASGHDLRKLLMLLQFWSQGFPVDSKKLDDFPVAPEELVIGKQNSDLVNCLLQLDGCPQVPATKLHGMNQKSSIAECNSREPTKNILSKNGTIAVESSRAKTLREEDKSIGKTKDARLDTEWLFAYDSQHRLLPLLFPSSAPCLLTAYISEFLKGVGQRAMEMTNTSVATWSRHRSNELHAKAEAVSQAKKALRKLQAAARKEANGKPSITKAVANDITEEVLQDGNDQTNSKMVDMLQADGPVAKSSSAGAQSTEAVGDRTGVFPPPERGAELVSLGTFDPATLTEPCETSRSLALLDYMDEELINDRADGCLSSPWLPNDPESQHSLLAGYPTPQNQQAMGSQAENNAGGVVDFSFIKLMQGSYDSPAAQAAMKECNEDTWSLLHGLGCISPEECEGDSPLSSLLRGHNVHDLVCEDHERPVLNMDCSLTSQETGWMLQRQSAPDLPSNVDLSCLGVVPLQQTVHLPVAAENAPLLSPRISVDDRYPEQKPPELGAVTPTLVDTPVKEAEHQATPIQSSNLVIHGDEETPVRDGEHPPRRSSIDTSFHTLASDIMKQVWSNLRELKPQRPMPHEMGDSVLLDKVLYDLSGCDVLSSRNAAAAQNSLTFIRQGRSGDQEDTYGGSRDACQESAALLAQLLLNQALDQIIPPNTLLSETWQVGPSVSQHEYTRQEKQACEDELVETLLPQRCRLLGALGRLEYTSFHSRLTPRHAARREDVRTGPATRQRKLA